MKHPDDEVSLWDGQGHMTGQEHYWTHINMTVEPYQVGFMFNHKQRNPHICTSFRNLSAATIELSMARMWMEKTWIPPE